ncbi:MAG TPA: YbjQ family protein [Pirellulales bacterium]|jgi:uncharacterized protein YbjQ (UPF0145 family)|nr:YbjQ family protein [Pirellulales bacterium]
MDNPYESPRTISQAQGQPMSLSDSMITTAFELPGYRIVRNLGMVRGIVVRSRSILGNIGAGLQSLVGGNITLYTSLCEKTRMDAYFHMIDEGNRVGASAIIGVRYDANEVAAGITEVLCYGTAVGVEPTGGV